MAEEVGKMLVWFVNLQLKGYEGTSILGGGGGGGLLCLLFLDETHRWDYFAKVY